MAAGGIERHALPACILAGEQIALHPYALRASENSAALKSIEAFAMAFPASTAVFRTISVRRIQPLHSGVIKPADCIQFTGRADTDAGSEGIHT